MSATPILDLEEPVPQPRSRWFSIVIGLLIGLAIGAALILADQGFLPDWGLPSFNGLLLIPALYAAITIHEVGHLLAAVLVGFAIGTLGIGGFVVSKCSGRWRFSFDRRRALAGYFRPLTKATDFDVRRFALMVAGGPVASILLSAACIALWTRVGDGRWSWLGTFVWVAFFLVVMSLVPFSTGLTRSDGARLLQLLRDADAPRRWMALIALQTEEANGVRPSRWDPALVREILQMNESAPEYPFCQLMAYYRCLDTGSEEQALVHLESALSRSKSCGNVFRHALFLEAASASALLRKQAKQARAWRDRAHKLSKPKLPSVCEAGIAMCEGRYEEAVRHWQTAQAYIAKRKLDSGLIRFASEKWAEKEAECHLAMAERAVWVR